jgi:FlaA1/EpsC-like NDP-sugar epimerase
LREAEWHLYEKQKHPNDAMILGEMAPNVKQIRALNLADTAIVEGEIAVILITGASGNVGREVVKQALTLGLTVRATFQSPGVAAKAPLD